MIQEDNFLKTLLNFAELKISPIELNLRTFVVDDDYPYNAFMALNSLQ